MPWIKPFSARLGIRPSMKTDFNMEKLTGT